MQANGWWVRASDAEFVCRQLEVMFGEKSYYRDIRVWLPDWEFPGADPQHRLMPPCPSCRTGEHVTVHSWREGERAGRRICDSDCWGGFLCGW